MTSGARFRNRLGSGADAGEALRAERVLAAARAFLAICALAAIYLDPSEPSRYARLAYASLLVYAGHSLLILAVLRTRQNVTPRFCWVLHGVDVLWPAYITLFTEGSNSPFFPFFIFVLLAAAYRWGLRETVLTAILAIVLLFTEALLVGFGSGGLGHLVEGEVELNRLIIRSTYLLMLAMLVGYLAEEEKQLRAETYAVTRVLSKVQVDTGLRRTIHAVLGEFLEIYQAKQALLALQGVSSGEIFLWESRQLPGSDHITFILSEVPPLQQGTYFFPVPAKVCHAVKRQPGPGWELLGLSGREEWRSTPAWEFPAPLAEAHPFSRGLMVVCFRFREEWDGRLLLLDPQVGPSRKVELAFARDLLDRVLPAVYNVYLVRRLRSQVGAVERARVARELHDGVMQSLSAAVMKMDLLRRHASSSPATIGEELGRLQEIIRQEVVTLRELMDQMRPLELAPPQLLDFLADLIEKFRRETGINARFISDLEEISLRPRVCRELARIVQEALVNVRRHSGARNVVVRFTSGDGIWKLVVDDDGQGFPFSGRLSQTELDAARKGPLVIKERVRAIGGELTVDSLPGRGSRLEITIGE